MHVSFTFKIELQKKKYIYISVGFFELPVGVCSSTKKKLPISENIGERGIKGPRFSIFSGIGHF